MTATPRPLLRLVTDLPEPRPQVSFCGHCGQEPAAGDPSSRVCARCGLGVVITAADDIAPKAGEPFLIVDRRLMLCGVSRAAEKLLGIIEPSAVHRHIGEFLEPADAEAGERDELVRGIVTAAGSDAAMRTMVLRPVGEYGVRYAARVGSCGPPAGAIIVLAGV